MNNDPKHIEPLDFDPEFFGMYASALSKNISQSGFNTPENYFENTVDLILKQTKLESLKHLPHFADLKIPNDKMDDLTNRILSVSDKNSIQMDEHFFESQKEQILSQVNLFVANKSESEFSIDPTFFDKQQTDILGKIKTITLPAKNRVFEFSSVRRKIIIYSSAAAACLVMAFLFFKPSNKSNSTQNNFETVLADNPVDLDDLPYIIDESDFYESFLIESGLTEEEYLTIDSLLIQSESKSKIIPEPEIENSKKNTKNDSQIKPSPSNLTPNWDELSEDEILEYLYQDESMELLEELH